MNILHHINNALKANYQMAKDKDYVEKDGEILIVDEILSVGDAGFQAKSLKRMMELMSGGTTVLFVSHTLKQIEELCNRVVWLEDHKVKKVGDVKEICEEYRRMWES